VSGSPYPRPRLRAFLRPKAMHFPAIHPKRDSIRRGRILSAVAILMATSCHACDKDRVARIDIIPDIVIAAPNKPFLVSVRLTNGRGQLMPDESAAELRWEAGNPHLTLSANRGPQTTATLLATAGNSVTLTAKLSDITGTATISKAKAGESLITDWATSEHIDGQRPTLVLIDGQNPLEWRSDTLIAYVGGGGLDDLRPSDDPGEVTVFSPGHALQRVNVGWTERCDHVRMTEGGVAYATEMTAPSCTGAAMSLAKPTSIPVHIWTLVAADNPGSVIEIHLKEARRKLANGWTGLTLDLEAPGIESLPEKLIVLDLSPASDYRCPTGGEFSLAAQLKTAGVAFGPGKVTVVYTAAIMEPSLSGFVPANMAGYACPRDATLGTVVLISWTEFLDSTLAHELGHAIGPPLIHTDGMVGLDNSNLMWSGHIAVPASREVVTLGQAFRLSLDADRFHPGPVSPTDPRCTGQNEGAETPCPRVAKDVVRE
jgi:hypothetical protein